MTGLLYDKIFLEHETGRHPESPLRLTAIIDRLVQIGLYEHLVQVPARPADVDEVAMVHDRDYISRIKSLCESGGGHIDLDTVVSRRSYDAALCAAGGCIEAGDAVMDGKIENAFCAVRPPGHHSLVDRAMGFCIFNNIAILARHLQKRRGLTKIFIVDLDIHHGNGTQETFYAEPDVFFFSMHRSPLFPGTGFEDETGTGAGKSTTLNVPLYTGIDRTEYLKILRERMAEILAKFKPEFILLSIGFDTYKDDPIGGVGLEQPDYGIITALLMDYARQTCGGRLISVLEGGYNLAAIGQSVEAHIRELMGMPRKNHIT